MPDRRANGTIDFTHAWEGHNEHAYRATLGYFESGELGEIFVNAALHDTPLDANARDASVMVSLALQYGAPLDVLRHAVQRDIDGYAASPIGRALDLIVEGGLDRIAPHNTLRGRVVAEEGSTENADEGQTPGAAGDEQPGEQ